MYIYIYISICQHLHPFEVDWWGGCHARVFLCSFSNRPRRPDCQSVGHQWHSYRTSDILSWLMLVGFGGNYTQNSWNTLEPWIITDDFWPQSPSPGLGGCTSGCSTQRGGSRYGLASQGLTSRAPPWEFPMWLSMWLFFWLSPDTQCLYHLYHLYYCFPLSTNLYLFQCELRAVEPGDWTACSMHEFASLFRKMPLEAAAARTFWQEAMRGCGYSF